MVKFIASDLDGTLLDDDKHLPEEIFPLIEELATRNILFAPASGRQYANLRTLFSSVADKVVFICENGAHVKYRGQTLSLVTIDDSRLKSALDEIRAIPGLFPMLCAANCSYIENDEQPFSTYARKSYTNCKKVHSLDSVIGKEKICKISVYDDIGAAENCMKRLPERIPGLRVTISGREWCDVAAPEANKGEAIRVIRRVFGLQKEECVAFGDHMNDVGMLEECAHAFVPENGYPPLKERFRRIIPSNTEGGVLSAIKKILEKEN